MIKTVFWVFMHKEGLIFEYEADFDLMILELEAFGSTDPKISHFVESF